MDPYADPVTGVLTNKLGITDEKALRAAEADITAHTIAGLLADPEPGGYDLPHMQAIHRRIFEPLYPWAGEIRTVNIARHDVFCLHQHIGTYAADTFAALAAEQHLRGLDLEPFVDRLAHHYCEILAIHPFREGNGRAQRVFIGQLAREAGYRVDWTGRPWTEWACHADAGRAAMRGDAGPIRQMLVETTSPLPGH